MSADETRDAAAPAHSAESGQERAHHPDCPALYFTGHPERCRCIFMAMLDRVPPRTPSDGAR